MPTQYSLRHYWSWDTECLRNWRFEGSLDGVEWTVLKEHVEDMALNGKGSTYTWPLPAKFHEQTFSKFRIFQTGINSNKHYYLALSGFEIYGKLISLPNAVAAVVAPPQLSVDHKPTFAYSGTDFDGHGIIHFIATQGGAKPWTNPAVAGYLKVTASSLMDDSTPSTDVVGNRQRQKRSKRNPKASDTAIDALIQAIFAE